VRGFSHSNYVAYLRRALRFTWRDELLLELAVGGELEQKKLAQLFDGLDIAHECYRFNLLLALICDRMDFHGVPENFAPRLRGIIRYYHFHNAALLSKFSILGRALNAKGIPILLLKGAAMRAMDDQNRPRAMGDVDFAVPATEHNAVLVEAKRQGFSMTHRARHAVDLRNGQCQIDVHRTIFHDSQGAAAEEEIWRRASPVHCHGVDALLPAPEDMFLSLVCNEFRNILYSDRDLQYFQWIHDCAFLLQKFPDFDWCLLLATANGVGLVTQLKPMVGILRSMLPALVPEELSADRWKLQGRELDGIAKNLLIHATSIKNWERKRLRLLSCRSLRDVRHYISTKIKYRLLKCVRKCRPLRRLAVGILVHP
jgi:hypothetical protein